MKKSRFYMLVAFASSLAIAAALTAAPAETDDVSELPGQEESDQKTSKTEHYVIQANTFSGSATNITPATLGVPKTLPTIFNAAATHTRQYLLAYFIVLFRTSIEAQAP